MLSPTAGGALGPESTRALTPFWSRARNTIGFQLIPRGGCGPAATRTPLGQRAATPGRGVSPAGGAASTLWAGHRDGEAKS